MAIGVTQRLDQTGRHLVPFLVTIAAMLLGMVALPLPGYSWMAPPFTLMAIYYWVIHRPDLLRPGTVFAIGVLQDLLSYAPLGLTTLTFVLVYWVVLKQRRFFLGNSFAFLWFGFLLIDAGAGAAQWAIYSLMEAHLVDLTALGMQTVMAAVTFPLAGWVFSRLNRGLLSE